MNYQFSGLDAELFNVTDEALRSMHARWVVVDAKPGYPCRVTLEDAEVGETVLLLEYRHHDVDSPYAASGAIFVRPGHSTAKLGVNEVPLLLRHRLLSVRGYDQAGMLLAADVVQGAEIEVTIEQLFSDPAIAYLHVHNARPGCFNCRVDRAEPS